MRPLLPLLAALVVFPGAANAYSCIEVAQFLVDSSRITTKGDKRAAMIPDELLEIIQKYVAFEVPLAMPGVTGVVQGQKECAPTDRVAVLTGTVTDYKPGNRTVRYLVGFGAGSQKVAVEAVLTDKATGTVLGRGEVVDHKVAGWAGGSEEKGLDDFSEKVVALIKRSIGQRGS